MGYAEAGIGGRVQVPQLHSPGRFLPFLSGYSLFSSSPQQEEDSPGPQKAGRGPISIRKRARAKNLALSVSLCLYACVLCADAFFRRFCRHAV